MKLSVLVILLATTLTACSYPTKPSTSSSQVANPASAFCVEIGGKSVIKKDSNGNEYGVCQLPNGKEVDEWAFYRESAKIIIEGDTIK